MKKRERIIVNLFMENGYPKAKKQDGIIDAKEVLEFLDKCRVDREIKKGKIIKRGNYVDYIYDLDVFDYDIRKYDNEIRKYCYVIRIKNSDKHLYYETVKYLETLCDLAVTLKKVNVARLTAGILAGTFVLVNAGPHIIKGLERRNDAKNKYQNELYQEIQNNINSNQIYYPTKEEKQEAEDWYNEYIEKENIEPKGRIR